MDDRIIALLEDIAVSCANTTLERDEYLRRLYASRQQSAATVHGDLPTFAPACAGEVSQQEGGVGVLWDLDKGAAVARGQEVQPKVQNDFSKLLDKFKRRTD